MRKGKAAAIFVLLVLLVGLFIGYRASHQIEPGYQGTNASAWLDNRDTRFGNQLTSVAREALKAMGTNAVPSVVRRLEEGESPVAKKYKALFPKFPAWLTRILPRPRPEFSPMDGSSAFLAIGASVEPLLIGLLKDQSSSVRQASAAGLGFLRFFHETNIDNAIPNLTATLRDKDVNVRFWSAQALGYIGSNADSAVPSLIPLLADPETNGKTGGTVIVRAAAARALGKIGPKANAALPSLMKLLEDNDNHLRAVAAIAIWRIDGGVTNTLPVLTQWLTQVQEGSKWEVIEGIGEMGPRAKEAVPALLRELEVPAQPTWYQRNPTQEYNAQKLTNALKQIDPEAIKKRWSEVKGVTLAPHHL